MGRALVVIRTPADRNLVASWANRAPEGTRVTFLQSKRSTPQNSRMWALLTAIAKQLVWHGQRYSTEDWKYYFMHAYRGEKWMPAEDGGMVPIGHGTSDLDKAEHSELTALMEAFCARQGVVIEHGEVAA